MNAFVSGDLTSTGSALYSFMPDKGKNINLLKKPLIAWVLGPGQALRVHSKEWGAERAEEPRRETRLADAQDEFTRLSVCRVAGADMSQAGKTALVTGGAQGIGRAFVEALLQHGAHVAMCDVNPEVGETAVKELSAKYPNKVIFLRCDVTNDQQFDDCFRSTKEAFGGLDLVINNAGIGNERDEGWKKMIDINLTAVIVGTKLGFKHMGKDNGGKGGMVINIASITALEPFPTIPVYSATKAAVNQLSRSFGSELYLLKTGVKVLSINPGMTHTALTATAIDKALPDDQDIKDHFVKHFSTFYLQDVANMGKGLIEVLNKGQNGSMWTIEDDQPAKLTILK